MFSSCSPPCCRVPLCPLLHSPGARPSAPLSPPFLPSLRLSSRCLLLLCVPWLPAAVCPLLPSPFIPIWRALKLSCGLPSCLLCLVVLWWLPSLVKCQAQNAMTVGADAARICPRPCLLLPMCCRWLFRGFLSCVRVCVLLPCVVWWQ